MLKKFKEHCGRPITWGKYYKLCGVSTLLSIMFTLGWLYWLGMTSKTYEKPVTYGEESMEGEA